MARRDNLPRRGTPAAARKRVVDKIPLIPRFLIVCEGTQTEPGYFKQFRVPGNVVKIDVIGTGLNTIQVVQKALDKKQQARDPYDRVWCVFDRDSFPEKHFNDALDLAREYDIQVAYSNPAFELWFVLHYDSRTSCISRQQYANRLSVLLRRPYQKNDRDLYTILKEREPQAIKHAEALLPPQGARDPANDNPSTTVHLLVQELRNAAQRPWER
ncbi:MAG TPA: RloB family protein [Chloroflexia bacterium]|nr:RloB family protein [Chloroflexia bacterium]